MAVPEARSLMQHVEATRSECLNEDADCCLAKFLGSRNGSDASSTRQQLMSDDGDPQLLISLGFSVPVRLSGLLIGSANGSVADQTAPKKLRIFINKPNMSFADAESDRASDEFVLAEDASIENGVMLPLKQARYQNVASLQIFVVENGGGSVTKIDKLDVFGFPADNLQSMTLEELWEPRFRSHLSITYDRLGTLQNARNNRRPPYIFGSGAVEGSSGPRW